MSRSFAELLSLNRNSAFFSGDPAEPFYFDILKYIALKGECRLSQIQGRWPCDETSINNLLEDLINDMLIIEDSIPGDTLYSINSEMFLFVLDEMSNNAKRCIQDSDKILLNCN